MKNLTLVLIAVLVLVAGCGGPESPADLVWPGAPIVLISIDTLRSDYLPIYGYDGVETPAIDAFRADAILFERAYTHIPLTFPAHVSMLTGLLPTEHGVQDNAGYTLPDDTPYLPRLLRSAGYATAATVSSYALRGDTGMDEGFDFYDDHMEEVGSAHLWGTERFGEATLKVAQRWLDGLDEGKFFLFFHLYEPHLPHNPPEPFSSQYGRTYDGEIAAVDAVVGKFLDDLRRRGLYDEAIVMLVSDHGEGFMEHGEHGHGIFLYRESLQVPMVLKLPGSHLAGTSVAEPAQLIDVGPTLARLAGVEVPEGVRGISLLELVGDEPPRRPVYAETYYPRIHFGWSDLGSLIDGDYHYIEAPKPELYNLRTDPEETKNILPENRRIYADLRDRLKSYDRTLHTASEIDEATAERLAALGYLTASPPGDEEAESLPDPKDEMTGLFETMETAFGLYNDHKYEEALPIFAQLVEDNPGMTDAWHRMGGCLEHLGRHEEALAAYQRAIKVSPGAPLVAIDLGKLLLKLGRPREAREHAELARKLAPALAYELLADVALAGGRPDEAVRHLRTALESGQPDPGVRRKLGLTLAETGQLREALEVLEPLAREYDNPPSLNALAKVQAEAGRPEAGATVARVLEQDPENGPALQTAGLIALRQGRFAEARDYLHRALAAREEMPNGWNLLGVALFQLGDADGALDAWERSVALDGRQFDALYNLGISAAQLGRREQARRALRRYVATAPPARLGTEIARARALLQELGG